MVCIWYQGRDSLSSGTPPVTSEGHLHKKGVQSVTLVLKMFMRGSRLLWSAAGTCADCVHTGSPENCNWLGLWTKTEYHTSHKQQEAFLSCSFESSKVKQTGWYTYFKCPLRPLFLPSPSLSLGAAILCQGPTSTIFSLCLGVCLLSIQAFRGHHLCLLGFQLHCAHLLSILFVCVNHKSTLGVPYRRGSQTLRGNEMYSLI